MQNTKIDNFVNKLGLKFLNLELQQQQFGYPANYKDLHVLNEAKFKIGKTIPIILNSGQSLNYESVDWISSLEEESELILELIGPWGGNKENTWAYITSGGTEGNLAGFKFAIKAFPGVKPILLYSIESHFSVEKAIEMSKESFRTCLQIPTLRNGEIDYKQIIPAVKYIIGQKPSPQDIPPVIVIATLGTTMKGACDNITLILDTLYSIGLTREKIFIHVDAAFHGGFWHLDKQNPNYKIGVEFNSIAISGWKWYGSDVCGLFAMFQEKDQFKNEGFREYLMCQDIGIGSTRDGFRALSWMIRYLQFDWQVEYNTCQKNVKFAEDRFHQLGIQTFINPASLIICTPELPKFIRAKYILASYNDLHLGKMSHIVVCPHVTEERLEVFFKDLATCINEVVKEFH